MRCFIVYVYSCKSIVNDCNLLKTSFTRSTHIEIKPTVHARSQFLTYWVILSTLYSNILAAQAVSHTESMMETTCKHPLET